MSECLPVLVGSDAQVELFPRGSVDGDEAALVRGAKEYLHTGKIACRDEDKVRRVVEMVLMGASIRQIKRACGVGQETIAVIREYAVASGKLGAVKERLLRLQSRLAEVSTEKALELIEEDRMPPNMIPMVMGVSTDKMLLLMGEATVIHEHKEGPSEEGIRAYVERLRAQAVAQRRAQEMKEANVEQVRTVEGADLGEGGER
jgi:hypothetical protein